jgi:uncharacterized protein
MAARFVLKKGSSGKFHFNLVASNGQVIASSESYQSKASALQGIESVKRNAPNAEADDQPAARAPHGTGTTAAATNEQPNRRLRLRGAGHLLGDG